MANIDRMTTSEKIKPFVNLNDGSYYYNYDVREEGVVKHFDDENESPVYSFIQIRCWGKPNYKDCVKNIIRKYITQEEEFDLINSANSIILSGNIDDNNIDILKYKDYLRLVKEIKANVKKDFK